jgi:hypothetical protein
MQYTILLFSHHRIYFLSTYLIKVQFDYEISGHTGWESMVYSFVLIATNLV